ncbi:chromo domain containing protein [Grosmannia clavigera kw1407]|uniref:Chromo domain containing protein n=1 Tax=Grosmannia clavigera (strain kw1407 / UAMH 11150) TaxID=655863 RepID=F0X985_GROCL|nr:chromo domain containing protein [Grosmannia clavigera kw1407]EFX05435.1 chromo domain containing protein [Grosmannia clavigera kw1407]
MPPALSDDEMSDSSGVGAVTTPPPSKRGKKVGSYASLNTENSDEASDSAQAKKRGAPKTSARTNGSAAARSIPIRKGNGTEDEASKNGVTDENGDDGSDDSEAEEEYEVERIIGHMLNDAGDLLFHVTWKGYNNPKDYTWEPEENLAGNASEILNEYIAKLGSRENLFEKPNKGKKRGRQSLSATTPASMPPKRTKKNGEHPADRETPLAVENPFKPPAGSWEDDVVDVEMYRNGEGELIVCLTWKAGQKSQHPAQQTYMRCPQKILRFYESHISFKTDTE